MKILIIATEYPRFENLYAYAFVHTRAKVYAKTGNKVRVFVPTGKTSQAYVYDGIDIVRTTWMSFLSIVNEFDPDVLAVHAPKGQWSKYISKGETPVVSWIHGAEAILQAFHHYYIPFSFRDNILKSLSLLTDPVKCLKLSRFLRMSDAVVYVSHWMKNETERWTSIKHPISFIIPNPVDINLFKGPIFSKKSEHKDGISLRALGWKYGLDVAIKAYSNMKETRLTIFGKGPLEGYLRNLARLCESNVEFVIDIVPNRELPEIYNKCGYFVAPSRTESQGVAMCEAMACGLPVIATRVGGIPEFVKDNYNGLLIPPENPIKLRKAVRLLVSDSKLYASLSENAVNFVEKNLAHNVIYEKERQAFEQALETHGRKRK